MTTRFRLRARSAALVAVLIGLGAGLVASPAGAAPVQPSAVTATSVTECGVDSATLTWGFKESFRSYISSTIANGEWTVANGASYETPDFGFTDGAGSYDTATGVGLIGFAGSITFTGHGGILNTTVANPQLQFIDADSAVLLLDVTGTTQEGEVVSDLAVEFVDLELGGAVEFVDGSLVVTDAAAVLTADGAAAFGTYPEGEPFDPVNLTAVLEGACETGPVADDATDTPGDPETDMASDIASLWWVWVLLALVVIAAVIAAITVARRRRA